MDEKVIDSVLEKISENEVKEMKTHIVYAGTHYWLREDRLKSVILKSMKSYEIKKVIVTVMFMRRLRLITKERMELYCKRKSKLYQWKNSVNDDIESLFHNLRLGKESVTLKNVNSYFFPKLTEDELELIEKKDLSYLQTFYYLFQADVKKAEMKISESDSKFVFGLCNRYTFKIENSFENASENESQTIFNCCSLQ